MNSRNGKIARLPKAIREELNRRLDDGASGRSLVAWLNGLAEVRAVLQAHFGGTEIRDQNLSEWKKGGFQDWLRHQEAMALTTVLHEQATEMQASAEGQMPTSEVLALWLSARYALATREVAATGGEEGWKLLRQLCGDVAKLRRIEQQKERLAQHTQRLELEAERIAVQRAAVVIERERWEMERLQGPVIHPDAKCRWDLEVDVQQYDAFQQWFRKQDDEEKIKWVRYPENWKRIRPLTDAEAAERDRKVLDEIMGQAPNTNP